MCLELAASTLLWVVRIVAVSSILLATTGAVGEETNVSTDEVTGNFSSDYREARFKFLAAARSAGAIIESHRHPLSGPDGTALFMDVAMLGPADARSVLVIGSGTHGVEGFAGSAVQTGLLQERFVVNLPPDVRVIMIHAINPYGFAYLRRFNEDNVDVNRNFVNHGAPYPANEGYDQLADSLFPQSLTLWQDIKAGMKLAWYYIRHGMGSLRKSVAGGQFDYPKGLFYGGHTPVWSNLEVEKFARQHMSMAQTVVFLDLHTGLGSFGQAKVINNELPESPAYRHLVGIWGDRARESAAKGDVRTLRIDGTLKRALPKILPSANVTAVTVEFGTYSHLVTLRALREENWVHHNANPHSPEWKDAKEALLQAFFPGTDDWKRQVWTNGHEVINQAIAFLEPRATTTNNRSTTMRPVETK